MIFSKFFKKLQLPSDYSEAASEVFGSSKIKLKSVNIGQALPGDLVTFSYNKFFSSRRFLVVATESAPNGKFISGLGNKLICGYDLSNKETLPGLVMILNSFYKRRRSSYKLMKNTMTSIMGPETYKTFKVNDVTNSFLLEFVNE